MRSKLANQSINLHLKPSFNMFNCLNAFIICTLLLVFTIQFRRLKSLLSHAIQTIFQPIILIILLFRSQHPVSGIYLILKSLITSGFDFLESLLHAQKAA